MEAARCYRGNATFCETRDFLDGAAIYPLYSAMLASRCAVNGQYEYRLGRFIYRRPHWQRASPIEAAYARHKSNEAQHAGTLRQQ